MNKRKNQSQNALFARNQHLHELLVVERRRVVTQNVAAPDASSEPTAQRFLVSATWYNKWMVYIDRIEEDLSTPVISSKRVCREADVVPQIDNSSLIACDGQLLPNLHQDVHYRAFHPVSWSIIKNRFGLQPGHELVRRIMNLGPEAPSVLEVYPYELEIYFKETEAGVFRIVAPRDTSLFCARNAIANYWNANPYHLELSIKVGHQMVRIMKDGNLFIRLRGNHKIYVASVTEPQDFENTPDGDQAVAVDVWDPRISGINLGNCSALRDLVRLRDRAKQHGVLISPQALDGIPERIHDYVQSKETETHCANATLQGSLKTTSTVQNDMKLMQEMTSEQFLVLNNKIKQLTEEHKVAIGRLEQQLEQKNCNICFDQRPDATLIPCGHCVCFACGEQMSTCPLCRNRVERVVKIYLP